MARSVAREWSLEVIGVVPRSRDDGPMTVVVWALVAWMLVALPLAALVGALCGRDDGLSAP